MPNIIIDNFLFIFLLLCSAWGSTCISQDYQYLSLDRDHTFEDWEITENQNGYNIYAFGDKIGILVHRTHNDTYDVFIMKDKRGGYDCNSYYMIKENNQFKLKRLYDSSTIVLYVLASNGVYRYDDSRQ